jgi:hypothetical protein
MSAALHGVIGFATESGSASRSDTRTLLASVAVRYTRLRAVAKAVVKPMFEHGGLLSNERLVTVAPHSLMVPATSGLLNSSDGPVRYGRSSPEPLTGASPRTRTARA